MKPALTTLMISLLAVWPPPAARGQSVVYVDDSTVGANDGTSWSDAFRDLQAALDAVEASQGAITEIWVASGIYIPTKRTDPEDPRSATFAMVNGVSMYGGFAGTESSIDEREIDANPTILSGDLNGDDGPDFSNYDENVWHVVTAKDINSRTVFDGFTASGGNAPSQCGDGGGGGMVVQDGCPLIRNCIFSDHVSAYGGCTGGVEGARGGALRIDRSADHADPCVLEIEHSAIVRNRAAILGGGMFIRNAQVSLLGCRVSSNSASGGGGIALDGDSELWIESCSFENNTSQSNGGALLVENEASERPRVRTNVSNCSFVGNTSSWSGGGIYHLNGGLQLDRCDFLDNSAVLGGAVLVLGGELETTGCRFVTNNASEGGALSLVKSKRLLIATSSFENNSALGAGGAISTIDQEGSASLHQLNFVINNAEYGGAAYFHGEYVQLRDSTFYKNRATRDGGGMYVATWSGLEVDNVTFANNQAARGGAALVPFRSSIFGSNFEGNQADQEGGALFTSSEFRAQDCVFAQNSAGAEGGAAFILGSSEFNRCDFRSNVATRGGGVFASWSLFRAADCIFDNNNAIIGGGVAGDDSPLLFERCRVTNNKAEVGGGVSVSGGIAQLASCLLVGNTSTFFGGAAAGGTGTLDILNSTVAHNSAGSLGGGIIGGDDTVVTNSIFWGNVVDPHGDAWGDETAQIEGIERVEISYSNIEGWTGLYGGDGNLGADPIFVLPDDPDGRIGPLQANFRLRSNSPCLNAGSSELLENTFWDPPPARLDLDGNPRVLCQNVDMGAYEFGVAGDMDCDLDFDLADFAQWDECAHGPGEAADCPAFDTDGDGDLDLHDLAGLFALPIP